MTEPLTTLEPLPPALPLPGGYDRHTPGADQRAVLAGLVERRPWAELSWCALVEELLALGRTDVPLAKLAESHVDAVRILGQAGATPVPGALYGVWASRSAQTGLAAVERGGDLEVSGTLRFASGAGLLDRALVPVWPDEQHHLLLELDVAGLPADASFWRTSAMAPSRTAEIRLERLLVPRDAQRGPVDFYLGRPGFQAGGAGVAACWAGGIARVLDVLRAFHPRPNPAQQVRFGELRAELVAAVGAVRSGARLLDDPAADTTAVALEVRTVVARAVHRVLATARLLTGPTGLALDDDVAHAVPDLELYVLQHNLDAALAALGEGVVPGRSAPRGAGPLSGPVPRAGGAPGGAPARGGSGSGARRTEEGLVTEAGREPGAGAAVVTGPGHHVDVWRRRAASSPQVDVDALRGLAGAEASLIVFSAHPDDESIGAGRLLAAWCRSGRRARAVLATAGEACVDHVGARPAGLVARRLAEWHAALAVLGVEAGATYGLPDSGLQDSRPALDAAVARTLHQALAQAGPDRTPVLLAPHPLDPHPDHRAVGGSVARVAAQAGVPVWHFGIWLTYWGDPGTDLGGSLVRVRVDEADDRAWRDAVGCFESQIAPLADGWGPVVPPEMLAHHDEQLLVLPDGPTS